MVAKVISGRDIKGALNYNEQKVLTGDAVCIRAHLFARETEKLTFHDKLNRFASLNERNRRTGTNTLHVSLNFDPTEKLSAGELASIADSYMDKIGFGDQPYLVYEHTDAAHQHIHIVTTLIQETGKRIPIHFLGKNQSERARKEIELEFGLVRAQGSGRGTAAALKPAGIEKVIYGKSLTHQSVKAVVRAVVSSYRYTSLAELNAVLRRYNVTADRGTEKSQMFAKKGLMYSIIDAQGKRVGIPIKASAIPGKPTLSVLEKQFALNKALRPGRESLKTAIDEVLLSKQAHDKETFRALLLKAGVDVVFRVNAEGRLYGMTFIDDRSRTVFNGSDLGKAYSGNAILERLAVNPDNKAPVALDRPEPVQGREKEDPFVHIAVPELLQRLFTAEAQSGPVGGGLYQRKKKKRRLRR